MPMIAMTTSNSTSVKALVLRVSRFTSYLLRVFSDTTNGAGTTLDTSPSWFTVSLSIFVLLDIATQ